MLYCCRCERLKATVVRRHPVQRSSLSSCKLAPLAYLLVRPWPRHWATPNRVTATAIPMVTTTNTATVTDRRGGWISRRASPARPCNRAALPSARPASATGRSDLGRNFRGKKLSHRGRVHVGGRHCPNHALSRAAICRVRELSWC